MNTILSLTTTITSAIDINKKNNASVDCDKAKRQFRGEQIIDDLRLIYLRPHM